MNPKWCAIKESNLASPLGRLGYGQDFLHRSLIARGGTPGRLSARTSRFVGPVLFTFELQG